MKKNNSFSNLLDEIFLDFESERPLVVMYHVSIPGSESQQKPGYEVESVNGYLTLNSFADGMTLFQIELMDRVLLTLGPLLPEERLTFLQQALVRCQKLYAAVTRVRHDGNTGKTAGDPGETVWVFRSPCGINMSADDVPEDAEQTISRMTCDYAEVWYLIVRQIMQELRLFRYVMKEFSEVVIKK